MSITRVVRDNFARDEERNMQMPAENELHNSRQFSYT